MNDKIYLAELRSSTSENFLQKIERLIEQSGILAPLEKHDKVAIKVHFGEPGNTSYLRPVYLKRIVSFIKQKGGVPFLTDCSTLYNGRRARAIEHIEAAFENGFDYSMVGAPIIIGDGLVGDSCHHKQVDYKHFKEISYGKEIHDADFLLSVAHFKGHEMSGFGGAIKNIGMGAASKKGKLAMHSSVSPSINEGSCSGCGRCLAWCPAGAISLEADKSSIDSDICIGCGECIAVCAEGAINIVWNESISNFQEKMVEYAKGIIDDKKGKVGFLNFLTDISPECDCYPYNDTPIVSDIGVVCGTSMVQIDQAAADLVNQQPVNPLSRIADNPLAKTDKFRAAFPNIDWNIQLDYGEAIGLGSRHYKLVKI